jgi:uncharacterized protein (TIGR02452 family)
VAEENEAFLSDPKYKDKFCVSIPKTVLVSQTKNVIIVPGNKKTCVRLLKGTTNDAIHKYFALGQNSASKFKIFAMNFANANHVGGGYKSGAMAQEEELCRTIPDLYPSLLLEADNFGNYNNGTFKWNETVKLSENLSVLRYDKMQSKDRKLKEDYSIFTEDPIKVNIVTAAAPNIGGKEEKITQALLNRPQLFVMVMKQLIRTCILTPYVTSNGSIKNEKSVFIGGAFGCGVFAPPEYIQELMFRTIGMKYTELIARIFKEVLATSEGIMTLYDEICFAIPAGENYDAFEKAFS